MLRRKPSNASEKEQVQKKKLSLQRSSSFKDFMKHKPTSPGPLEREFSLEETADSSEELSPVSSEWSSDLSVGQRTSRVLHGLGGRRAPAPSTASCSDRQSLDSGYCQRDSMRLEEHGLSYNGPFCDVIFIIEKPPVGTWMGKLHNKVGSFKFIYVNLLPDESPPARRRTSSKTNRGRTKPKTLEEVLDSMGLTELSSLLSMHGFQSLEDFTGLRESHLNELNITDPDQRSKILNATNLFRDSEDEGEPEEEAASEPRDSGCFESSENLESGREEAKTEEKGPRVRRPVRETEQLDDVREQLQQLRVDEGS
ncbi:unnamed protein product [Lampetra planeri]